MKQVKWFEVYTNGKIKRYCVDSTEEYECYVRMLRYANKDTVVTHIVYDDGTHDYIDIPAGIRTKQANEKALSDFRKLSGFDKYKECVHYGDIEGSIDLDTIDGRLSLTNMSIYGKNFLFILINGKLINYYELQ